MLMHSYMEVIHCLSNYYMSSNSFVKTCCLPKVCILEKKIMKGSEPLTDENNLCLSGATVTMGDVAMLLCYGNIPTSYPHVNSLAHADISYKQPYNKGV